MNVIIKKNENFFIMSVKDQGIGIPDVDKKYLFSRFFRANNATTIPGTGLGLNIVKKYLEYMNGKIHFESKVDVGTTFTLSIPREIKNEKNSVD